MPEVMDVCRQGEGYLFFSYYNEISDKVTYRGVCFGSQIEHSVGHCGQQDGGGVRWAAQRWRWAAWRCGVGSVEV